MCHVSKFSNLPDQCSNQSSKLTISLFVLLAICLFHKPAEAKYGDGSWTAEDTYRISTAKHFTSPDNNETGQVVPDLGDPPTAPLRPRVSLQDTFKSQLQALESSFVNTASREQMRILFNAIYPASENISIGWSGDSATCNSGETVQSFKDAVQLQINYFRAMAGVPAAITLSTEFNSKVQQAALMMSVNNQLNHFPPTTWSCYTDAGAEAARNSNLCLEVNGWQAVNGYISDQGSNNGPVGHRRWLLYPQTQSMGTGDVPSSNGHPAANALWVFDGNIWGPRPATRDEFVAWPPPGFVPYQIVFPRWSLSYSNADFSSSTITMTHNGVVVPVQKETLQNGYGEDTIVWIPNNLTGNYPKPSGDTTYIVTVRNVAIGGKVRSFTYNVTIFDPQVPNTDHVSTAISGPSDPRVGLPSHYTITPVPGVDSYQWRYARTTNFTGIYTAESGLSGVSAMISSGYNPVSTDLHASGNASYHLAQPDGKEQTLLIDRTFIPGPSGHLIFQSQLGWAMFNQTAVVEVSMDDGPTWQELYYQKGLDMPVEWNFIRRKLNLSPFTNNTIRIRFAYRLESEVGSYYPQTSTGFGWYLDDISFDNTNEVTGVNVSPVISIPSFNFSPPAVGSYILQSRALLYGQFPLEWGPVTRVTAITVSSSHVILSKTSQ